MTNPTTYVQELLLTGGTAAATFGTSVTVNLNSKANNLIGFIYSACDTVYTTAQGTAGDQLQFNSPSLGISNQTWSVGPWNSSGPATNSSGQCMVQDIIPVEAFVNPKGNEALTFALAANAAITTGHSAVLGVQYSQDLPPPYWMQAYPSISFARGALVAEAQQLTTTATNLAALSIPSWWSEVIACRSVDMKTLAITAAQYEQAYFNVFSTIPDVAPMQIPTNSMGSSLGTPVGTGMFDDVMPQIPLYFETPGGTQTVTPQVNLIGAVSTGNNVAFGIMGR